VSHHPNHRLLNHAGIPVIECMNNLVELRKPRVYLIALPLPITTLDASPVRAIAIEPED
jgi:kynurenine formamidase